MTGAKVTYDCLHSCQRIQALVSLFISLFLLPTPWTPAPPTSSPGVSNSRIDETMTAGKWALGYQYCAKF